MFSADFNKDGYIDLLGAYDNYNSAVFWGSNQDYSASNKTVLPCHAAGFHPEAADLNKDGWLDAIVVSGDTKDEYIYWGGPQGLSASNYTNVVYCDTGTHGQHGMSVADLNYDGWLDLVYAPHWGPDEAAILWGSAQAYNPGRYDLNFFLPLPRGDGRGYGGSSVADLNEDGYLDIVFFCNDNVPNRIFWGGPDGIIRNRYTDIAAYNVPIAIGGFVADLNYDDHLDVFAYDWHNTAVLYYGPEFEHYDLCTIGSHHGFSREIGNVYTREYGEEYCSSVFQADREVTWDTIWWDDSCPGSSQVNLAVRIGDSSDTSDWGAWVPVTNGEPIPGNLKSQYIQYRATFTYENPSHLPVLFLVGIVYQDDLIIVEPDQASTSFPGDTVTYELDVINLTSRSDIINIMYYVNTTDWFHEARDSTGDSLPDTDSDGIHDVGALPAGSQTKINVLVGIPDDVFSGVDTCIVYGRSSYPEGLYDSAILVTTVLPPVAIYVDPDQDTMALAGEIITFSLVGGNVGRDPDVIDLAVTSARGWNVELLDENEAFPVTDNDSDGLPDLDTMFRGDSKNFTARVSVPASATEGTVDTVTVLGRSSQDELITDQAVLIIEVIPEVKVIVEPDQDTSAYPGQEIDFELWGANYGLLEDVIDLTAASVSGWQVELLDDAGSSPLADSNADGIPDVGPLERFDREYFTVRVTVPEGIGISESDTVNVLGRSSIRTDATDDAVLVINPLEVTDLEIRPDQTGTVSTESPTLTYELQVINHGNGPETADITWEGKRGWKVALYDSTGNNELEDSDLNGIPDVGELAAFGGSASLFASVTMPADMDPTLGSLDTSGTSMNVVESTWVYVASSSDGHIQDEAVLETIALPGLSLHNYPNPFHTSTTIVWSQPEQGHISLKVADRAGRPVGTIFSDNCEAGVHTCFWFAMTKSMKPLAPGVYILLLEYNPNEGRDKRIYYKMLCTRGGRQ
ncbi:hypothetical protein GF359_00485 [candidate division WOR-3 bacterium]|uniref:VCBS repeat-containing protein n=1 Tax=candidate division WOR-3 bacterium TaxID=2052148 RepID=A0A9D5K8N6_UNCW3|nr:hypothetical protein [candidate division WOR-3 bacterium]MBD3363670.1 hypothetical protein [candidate division WOR-3 bacterium]